MELESWALYSVVFLAVFGTVQFGYLYVFREVKPRLRVNRRLAEIESGAYRPDLVETALKSSTSLPGFLKGFEGLVTQAGMRGQGRSLVLRYFVGWVVTSVLLLFVLRVPLAVGAGFLLNTVIFYGMLRYKRSRRIKKFEEQLPDVIDVIVRSLKAGHPFPVSVSMVGREMPDPSGTEFGLVSDEMAYGRDVRTALSNLYHRVGYEDLRFLTTSVVVQSQTGGNLGEILPRLSKLMRDRFKMKRKVRSLSAEGRFSAIALSLTPVALYGMMNMLMPTLYLSAWQHSMMPVMMVVGGILLAIGNFVMWKMVNFKV